MENRVFAIRFFSSAIRNTPHRCAKAGGDAGNESVPEKLEGDYSEQNEVEL